MYYQKLAPPHQTHLVFCVVSQLKIKYNTNKKQLSLPKDCPEVVVPSPRTSSVQFYSCQTQHSPFLCKLFTFYILIFFYSKHFIHYDMVLSRLSWAWRDIYVVRSSQFIFCLSHNMTLFLEHSRLVNKKYFSYWKYKYKSRCYVKNVWLGSSIPNRISWRFYTHLINFRHTKDERILQNMKVFN